MKILSDIMQEGLTVPGNFSIFEKLNFFLNIHFLESSSLHLSQEKDKSWPCSSEQYKEEKATDLINW